MKRIWKNYQSFSDPINVSESHTLKRRGNDRKNLKGRLNNFICKTKENKIIIGFGGIENTINANSFRLFLSCRNVEASLFQLVLDVAFIGFPQVTEHFRKNQF